MDLGLTGKRAFVTGAGRGIGQAICHALAREGVKIAAVARTPRDLDRLLEELGGKGEGHFGISADLLPRDAPSRIAALLLEDFGQPDIVVHNLGGTLDVTNPLCNIGEWRNVMRLNCEIAVELNTHLLPGLRSLGWGRVINIGSVAAVELNGPPAYAAAKAALLAYTRCVGRLLAADGVIMSAILPGVIKTEGGYWEQIEHNDPERAKLYLKDRCPLGRFGTPQEVADLVAFLCSKRASFNPGAVWPLDGGQLRGYAFG
jgi:3-oxoacyl-[acyl-carrier protein] reductase